MGYIGKWAFHSIGTINDNDEMVYLTPSQYLDSPMEYIDTDDEEAVADELKERKQLVGSMLKVTEDNLLYLLMPLPEGVGDDEVKSAVDAGVITLMDGMLTDKPIPYEIRNGQLWCDMGMGTEDDPYVRICDDDGFLHILSSRYIKIN